MKKLFTLMCAALCSALMFAQTDTVYFVNADGWETVNVHAWDGNSDATVWPGAPATAAGYQLMGADVYYFTANAGDYGKCIFNNGSGSQTGDLTWTAGMYWYQDAWYTRAQLESGSLPETQKDTVFFVNKDNWSNVSCYGYNGVSFGNWPGSAMTNAGYQLKGVDVYYITAPQGSTGICIFNNNGNGSQTGNLTWTAGMYWYQDAWYTRAQLESAVVDPDPTPTSYMTMHGNFFGGWADTDEFTFSADGATATLTMDLAAGTYEFGVRVGSSSDFTANAANLTREANSTTLGTGNSGNMHLVADIAGEYVFTYTVATTDFTVTFPAKGEDPDPTPMSYLTMHGDFFGGWADTDEFTFSADGATATLTMDLAAGTYEFGVRVGSSSDFTANAANLTREANSTTLGTGNSGNMHLVADIAGEYVFTYIVATTDFTVTFPAGTGSNLIKVDAEPTAVKVVRDGQILIQRGGMVYTLTGQTIE